MTKYVYPFTALVKQTSIFDAERGEKLKREGMAKAADNSKYWLEKARDIARFRAKNCGRKDGTVTMDDVMLSMSATYGIDSLGPAAGSLFSDKKTWEFTGEFIKSKRTSNHSRLLRVWRLRENT